MNSTQLQESKQPSETALAAAYQVTARTLTNQTRVIGSVVSQFVTFNALVVAILQFVPVLHDSVRIVLPIVGIGYSVCWHFAIKRLWIYHDTYIRMMREQEGALGLGSLGPFSRAYKICEGGHGDNIGGDQTKFSATLRLRKLFTAIVWLFGAAYLAFLIDAMRRVAIT